MKIKIYAIAKNEERNVQAFMESVKDADSVFVYDTGSTDNTVKLLREAGAEVESANFELRAQTFDFATARNQALQIAEDGSDFYISLDLDERLEPDWRQKLEQLDLSDINELVFVCDNTNYAFNAVRGHRFNTHSWKYPIHEILTSPNSLPINTNIVFKHEYQEKTRNYMPLFLLGMQQYPRDSRMLHYFGRELMYNKQYDQAIQIFKAYFSQEHTKNLWSMELAVVCNYAAFCCEHLGKYSEAETYYIKACTYAPNCREPWLDLSDWYFRSNNTVGAYYAIAKALSLVVNRDYMYARDTDSSHIHHSACMLAYDLGKLEQAKQHIIDAISKTSTPSINLIHDYVFFIGTTPNLG